MRATLAVLLVAGFTSSLLAGCLGGSEPAAGPAVPRQHRAPVVNLNASLLDLASYAADERFGPDRPLTQADLPGLLPKALTNYNITLSYLLNMSLYPNIKAYQIGETLSGRAIFGFLLTDDGEFHADRPSIMLTCSQHGNEPSGSEACLIFIEYFTHGTDPLANDVRTKLNILVNPLANPDGKEANRRGNYDQVDINRDHMNLVTLEGRAIHNLYNLFNPMIALDLHEFGGVGTPPPVDPPYVTTRQSFQVAGPEGATDNDPNLFSANLELLRHVIQRSSEKYKWGSTGYFGSPGTSLAGDPSIHRHHFPLRNSFSLLFETGGGSGVANLPLRVEHQITGTFAVIEWLFANQPRATALVRDADASASRAQSNEVQAWLVPPQKDLEKAVHFLTMHGLNFTRLDADKTYTVQSYTSPTTSPTQQKNFPVGTLVISHFQPDGRLVDEIFENTDDGYYTKGPRSWPLDVWRVNSFP